MLETHLSSPITRQRLRTGAAAEHIDAFADWLHLNGYKSTSIHNGLTSLAGWTDCGLVPNFETTSQDTIFIKRRIVPWDCFDERLRVK